MSALRRLHRCTLNGGADNGGGNNGGAYIGCLGANVEYGCRNGQGQRYDSSSAAQDSRVQNSQGDCVYDANCGGGYYPCTSDWNTSSSSCDYERPNAPTAEAPTAVVPTTEAPTMEVPTTEAWKQCRGRVVAICLQGSSVCAVANIWLGWPVGPPPWVPPVPPGCRSLQAWPGSATPSAPGVSGVVSVSMPFWHAPDAPGPGLFSGGIATRRPLRARVARVLEFAGLAWLRHPTGAWGVVWGVAVACHLACSGCPWPWVVSGWHCHSPPASCACRLGAGVDRPGLAPPPCRRLGGLRVRSPVACHLACSGCPWPRAVPGWHCHSPPGLRGGQCRVLLPVHQTSMMSALC